MRIITLEITSEQADLLRSMAKEELVSLTKKYVHPVERETIKNTLDNLADLIKKLDAENGK